VLVNQLGRIWAYKIYGQTDSVIPISR